MCVCVCVCVGGGGGGGGGGDECVGVHVCAHLYVGVCEGVSVSVGVRSRRECDFCVRSRRTQKSR